MENDRLKFTRSRTRPSRPRVVLLNPGPVNTSVRVKSALLHADVCHRDPAYSDHLLALTDKLRRIFQGSPEHEVLLLTGSGTAAMECAIASTVPDGGRILVVDNGCFGERMAEIAAFHGMPLVHLKYDHGEEVRVPDVAAALDAHPDISVVAMVHHETSVGLLNPVREVGALCQARGPLFLVDAVSSLGAEDLDVVRDGIDVCWSSANKCLHAIPGASFLCVAPRVWARIADVAPRSYYLDLKRYRAYLRDKAQTPFTPAVATYFALEAACDEWLEDGHEARWEMYRARNRRLRDGLTRLGSPPFTATGRESHGIVTARLPDGLTFGELSAAMRERGFVIYDCKPPLQGQYFQVANMGDLDEWWLDEFLDAFADVVARQRRLAKTA